MTTTTPSTPAPGDRITVAPTWRRLAVHYVEMILAMTVGMLALGGFRAALGLTVEFAARPGAWFLLMATDMAVGMAAWMRFRRHGWPATLEMCAAMYLPAALLVPVRAGAMSTTTFMVAAHVVMCVAMLAVLVRRRRELAHC